MSDLLILDSFNVGGSVCVQFNYWALLVVVIVDFMLVLFAKCPVKDVVIVFSQKEYQL